MWFMMLLGRLGMNLKALREQRGLSQTELARRIRMTQPYIAMLERGAFTNPSLDVLRKLAKALKVRISELVD